MLVEKAKDVQDPEKLLRYLLSVYLSKHRNSSAEFCSLLEGRSDKKTFKIAENGKSSDIK